MAANNVSIEKVAMKNILVIVLGLMAMLVGVRAQAQEPIKHLNISSDRIALSGYDPVAYFREARAVKGKANLTTEHGGAIYRFTTEANRNAFRSAPTKYVPQYGGWCAYAMGANGEKVEVDPETFKVADGKLYLFYNRFFNNTLDSWNKDESRLKNNADRNWGKIILPNP